MVREIELKLAATPEKLKKIKELDFPGAASQTAWETHLLENSYYDTPSFKLREMSIAMRTRKIGEQYFQTVKSSGKVIGGLHQQNEDEIELNEPKLDITKITEPYLQVLVEEAFEEDGEFKHFFNTHFERTKCILAFSDGTKIEVSLDIGKITAGDKQEDICEIELELLEGSAEYIFAIGRYLIKDWDLALFSSSKARRGYTLCDDLPPDHYRMQVTELSKGIEAEKAFERICFSALKHWQYYELFLDRDNAHQAILEMYRALIYLQHMYIVFGGLIPREATKDLRNSWNWLAEAMRPIVDAAKHKRYLNRYLKQKADWDLVETQTKKIQSDVKKAIAEFKSILKTKRYNLMMLNMSQWLFFKEWRDFIPEKERNELNIPIVDFAKKQLEHMLKELKRDLGPKVELNYKDYFKLIAKLRRALDTGLFFGGLFDSQKRQSYRQPWLDTLDGIRELQMNDYIFQLQLETHDEDDSLEWLNERNEPVLQVIEQTRKKAFKSTPYWG